jgi:hypothetical protein
MSEPTGWGKRNRYRPDPGVEIQSDDTLYDVVEWRKDVKTTLEEIAGDTGGDASTATITTPALNSATSTDIKTASTDFVAFFVSNESDNDIWIKFQAASVDNDKKGIFLERGGYYEMPTGQRYTGVISAISAEGTPTISVVYY